MTLRKSLAQRYHLVERSFLVETQLKLFQLLELVELEFCKKLAAL